MLRVVKALPFGGRANDHLRLDVLLEDYLEEARVHNLHSTSSLPVNAMPTIDIAQLLRVPHKQRLDLSVLLTTSIYLALPEKLLKDSLIILLLPFISEADVQDLSTLPLFVRTAVVSLIRRTCAREIDELRVLQQLSVKPKSNPRLASDEDLPPPHLSECDWVQPSSCVPTIRRTAVRTECGTIRRQ